MASSNQESQALGGHGEEASSTSHNPATQQTSGPAQADNADISPSIPQPAASAHPQVLPQPFYGQQQYPYAPYPGQPGQPLPYGAPVRPLPQQSSAYIATRLGLTALSLVWGIVIIGLTSALLSDGDSASNVAWYAYPVSIVSVLWNAAELITYFVRKRKQVPRGIHPGAHVGLHLILWLVGAFSILLTTTVLYSAMYGLRSCQHQDDDPDSYSYYGYSYCGEFQPYDHYESSVLPAIRGLLAIFALWTINHFVLFVLACIDTHKRNVLRPAGFVVPIPAQAMYYPQQAVGAQPAQQPMQYYPYPAAMQPQPAPPAAGASNEKQPAQPAQNLAGFYAPAATSSAQAP